MGDSALVERLWTKVDASGDCWEWQGARNRGGYGVSWDGSRTRLAHRVVYEALVGPIPDGLEPDHLCRMHECVNPDHIELVTHRENIRRGRTATVNRTRQLAKTHCAHGHPLSGANVYREPDGTRQCRTCRRAAYQRSHA